MSGEADVRPNLPNQIRELRDRLYELERRVAGDQQAYDLSDLNDVRVDSLGDNTVTLADGNALTYRAADKLWVPGSTGGATPGTLSWFLGFDDGAGTALASDVAYVYAWTDSGSSSGADISASGNVLINTSGMYAVNAGVKAVSEVNGDTFDTCRGSMNIPRTAPHGDVGTDDLRTIPIYTGTKHGTIFSMSWSGFIPAGKHIEVNIEMFNGSPSTWTATGALIYVERLS